MADDTLLLLANEVRGKTLRLLDGVTDEQARFAGPAGLSAPLSNSILWNAGHALMVVEHLSVMPATGKPAGYPAGWFEKFSWQSKPATVTQWPTLAEVVAALRDQLDRLMRAVEPLTPEQLAKIVDPARGRTMRYSILHGLHDEANHQGEIHLLRKMLARQG